MSHDANCNCCGSNRSLEQNLDELKFESSIFNACVQGDMTRVKHLLNKNGKDVINQQDKHGYTCLHYSARNSHYDLSKFLIDQGAQVNSKTFSCQQTSLHKAAYIGNSKIVKLLLDNKANPLAIDCDGKNALHKCVEQYGIESKKKLTLGHIETIKLIFSADPSTINQKDNKLKTPIDYCEDLHNHISI